MSKASSIISTPISKPTGTSESKKRYLSSPFSPEDKLVKKNKAYNDSMESLDKSDVSVSLLDPVYEMETVGSAHLHTLPEKEIEKIANLLKSSIQGDILTAIKQDLSVISVGRCVIPWEFLGKSVKHTFSCRKMYPV